MIGLERAVELAGRQENNQVVGNSKTAARTGNAAQNTRDVKFDRLDVDFPSCAATLRGVLLLPRTEGPFPVIVMAPGMTGVKEGSIMQFAEIFASGGFAVPVGVNHHIRSFG